MFSFNMKHSFYYKKILTVIKIYNEKLLYQEKKHN